MNLSAMLAARADMDDPVRIGLIGAGKFGSMFLNQALFTKGIHVVAVADLDPEAVRRRCISQGWPREQMAASTVAGAMAAGTTCLTDDASALFVEGKLEVLIEATGNPRAGIRHCLGSIGAGIHVVMVNVEADAVAGPLLADLARRSGVVYSLAWGDQPALICEHVDWARTCGFDVICAGKGTLYHPTFHQSTPDTVWNMYGIDEEEAHRSGMNATMFNSFTDGTKSALEMTAVCNATRLMPQPDGLGFPPAAARELAQVCKPRGDGGVLEIPGTVEVVSSLHRDGSTVEGDLRFGTFVVVGGRNEYARRCFRDYSMLPDRSGNYAALYRPTHMVGLELGVSVASTALRREPTGTPVAFLSDTVAVAKRPLRKSEVLDGEGGYCVWGRQVPASRSVGSKMLPMGLAHRVPLLRDIAEGDCVRWHDVAIDENDDIVKLRREMEQKFTP